ncbi:MAG: adenosylcobinamide-GDP ribazoletransferase [Lachnospirales bacterium]
MNLKKYFKGFYMSLSMFSAIPLPKVIWLEELYDLIIVFLPLVGLIIGFLWHVVACLLQTNSNYLLVSAIVAITPFILSGFLHLDGYMDTSDAILSGREQKEKIRILKDSRVGAFSVIMLAILFLLQFTAVTGILNKTVFFIEISILSRCGSALAIIFGKAIKESNYVKMFKGRKNSEAAVFTIMVLTIIIFAYLYGKTGILVAFGVLTSYFIVMKYLIKVIGGVSGDLAGFSQTVSELVGLLCIGMFI